MELIPRSPAEVAYRGGGAALRADIGGFIGAYGDGFVCVPCDKGTALRAMFKNENISQV